MQDFECKTLNSASDLSTSNKHLSKYHFEKGLFQTFEEAAVALKAPLPSGEQKAVSGVA